MGQFKDAKELIEECKLAIMKIEEAYNESLQHKEIRPVLFILIKNFMENLRSALDYTANALFNKYGYCSKSNPNIYFPYAPLELDKAEFLAKSIIEKKIPGLSVRRPDIVEKIESYQHFESSKNNWLPMFMDLNNENKHLRLTPQVRKEKKTLKLTSKGRTMSLSGRMSIMKVAQMRMGDMIIPGGQSFDANNPPATLGEGTMEIISWVSFHFLTNNEPVLPFLKQALLGTENIIDELSLM